MNNYPKWLNPPEPTVDHLAEMKALKQWVCCKGNGDKKPIQPNGKAASSTDPTTWHTYEDAKAAKNHGFVLSSSDPFTIIDLDNPEKVPFLKDETEESRNERILEISRAHNDIIDMFNSYTELSMSGNGFHIIVKGNLPVKGFHNSKMCVEAYSSDRWMLFTERPAKNQPIELKQDELNELFNRFGTTPVQVKSEPLLQLVKDTTLTQEDQMIIDRAMTARNGAKFQDLYSGNWQAYFNDQSSADASLTSQIEFYTKDREQINRIFRSSVLAQRKKATERSDYVPRTIDHSLQKGAENRPPSVDISALDIAPITPAQAAERVIEEPETVKQAQESFRLPPGNMGALVRYMLGNAIRPVDEISTVSALGLIAGIAGRAWNINQAGLNIYVLLLAGTGRGKEEITTSCEYVISQLVPHVEGVTCRIGPDSFSSGQAIVRYVSENKCCVSIWAEFAVTLAYMTHPKAIGAVQMMKGALLKMYSRSGHGKILRSAVYADKQNNTPEVFSPAFSVVAESQPKTFFNNISEAQINDGLIPRFIVVQCHAPRGYARDVWPQPLPDYLLKQLKTVAKIAREMEAVNQVHHVARSPEAAERFRALDVATTDRMNVTKDNTEDQLENRVHLNTMKIAALLAVLDNPESPEITDEHAEWAEWFVCKCVKELAAEYSSGEHSGGYVSMRMLVMSVISEYKNLTTDKRQKNGVSPKMMDKPNLIPLSYISKIVLRKPIFVNLGASASDTLRKIVNEMVVEGLLDRVVMTDGRYGEVYSPTAAMKEVF